VRIQGNRYPLLVVKKECLYFIQKGVTIKKMGPVIVNNGMSGKMVVWDGKKTTFLVLILLQAGMFCFEPLREKKTAGFETCYLSAPARPTTAVVSEQRYPRTTFFSGALFKTVSVWEGREFLGCSETVFREWIFTKFPHTLQTLGCQLTI